jgi:ABC-2 type transport system permease protein
LIGYLLVPLLPLGLATIPTVIVMRFANLSKRKDLFRIVGAIVLIILVMVYQFTFQKSGMNINDPAFIKNLLTDQNGMIYLISRGFPSTHYLALSLVYAVSWVGSLYLLAFTGLSF